MIDIMLIVERTALLALSRASARVSTSVSSSESASITGVEDNYLTKCHLFWAVTTA
jgi:hypothetical protein